jgi:hypothetical protein
VLLAAAAGALALGGARGGAAAEAATPAVALVAAPGTRLADEIGRELAASRFEVVRIDVGRLPTAADNGSPDLLWAVPPHLARGVLVSQDERRVTVFERGGASGELHSRTDIRIDPNDSQVRRHACFAVVEYLRVMTLATNGAAGDPGAAPADSGRPSRAGGSPANVPAGAVVTAETAGGLPVLHQRPWTMGVAARLDLDTALGASTSELEVVWHFRIGPHLGIRARMLWPLVGASFTRADGSVRLWTFGTGVGVQYAFVDRPAPVRPFVGVALGTRLTLTETSAPATPENDGRTVLTPSLNLGLEVGIALRIARFAELFFESGATRDRLVPGLERSGVPAAAANALSFYSALGVMLEY